MFFEAGVMMLGAAYIGLPRRDWVFSGEQVLEPVEGSLFAVVVQRGA